MADRIVVLNFGQKIAEDTPERVVADPAVIDAYLGMSSMLEVEGGFRGLRQSRRAARCRPDREGARSSSGCSAQTTPARPRWINCLSEFVPTRAGSDQIRTDTKSAGCAPSSSNSPDPGGGRTVAVSKMTVRENLLLGGVSKRARASRQSTMERVLTLFPRLGERLDQASGTMSGGEQQMLAIGRD